MEINIKKVMSLDLYKILDIDEDATDSDVSNIVFLYWAAQLLNLNLIRQWIQVVSRHFGPETLRTQDTSDPRHFGTMETGPKCPDTSKCLPAIRQIVTRDLDVGVAAL